jgi:hypothetical protein
LVKAAMRSRSEVIAELQPVKSDAPPPASTIDLVQSLNCLCESRLKNKNKEMRNTERTHRPICGFGLRLTTERGWLWMHESGTYVKLTESGAALFA